jgi:hypothetical protein
MKTLVRNPEKFGVVELFDSLNSKSVKKMAKGDLVNKDSLVKQLHATIKDEIPPTTIYGIRTELMFAYVISLLGRCRLVKQEDSGCVFFKSKCALSIPDYRVVKNTGKELFIEVKNCYKKGENPELKMSDAYVKSLLNYTNLFGIQLYVAIYWSFFNIWTLVSLDNFKKDEKSYSISLRYAFLRNRMGEFGDYFIDTLPPLVFKILTNPEKSRAVSADGNCTFTIKDIEVTCAGQQVVEKREKDLAIYIAGNGKWGSKITSYEIVAGELISMQLTVEPPRKGNGWELRFIGSLSSFISNKFKVFTVQEDDTRIKPRIKPSYLGIKIPNSYTSDSLSIWKYSIHPIYGLIQVNDPFVLKKNKSST